MVDEYGDVAKTARNAQQRGTGCLVVPAIQDDRNRQCKICCRLPQAQRFLAVQPGCVVLGQLRRDDAQAAQAMGDGWFWPSAAAHPSLPRGARDGALLPFVLAMAWVLPWTSVGVSSERLFVAVDRIGLAGGTAAGCDSRPKTGGNHASANATSVC